MKLKKTNGAAVADAPGTTEPKAKVAKTPKTPAAPKEKAASKFVSLNPVNGTRMRVSEFQDYTFSINDRKDRRKTDEELAAEWRAQFPQAVSFTAFHVSGARRDYNKGVHSKAYPGKKDPASAAWFAAPDGKRSQTAPATSAKAESPKVPVAPKAVAADKPRKLKKAG